MKVCNKCKIEKSYNEFHIKKSSKDGYVSHCKNCRSEYSKKYYLDNSDNIKEKVLIYCKNNIDKKKTYQQKYYQDNKDYLIEKSKKWSCENYEEMLKTKNNYVKNRIKIDPIFAMKKILRVRLDEFIIGEKKSKKIELLIGCSWQELINHIESKFLFGMTWQNRGLKTWHIDHIIPLCSAKTEEEIYKLCHYTNLQPLWAKDNLKKGSKLFP